MLISCRVPANTRALIEEVDDFRANCLCAIFTQIYFLLSSVSVSLQERLIKDLLLFLLLLMPRPPTSAQLCLIFMHTPTILPAFKIKLTMVVKICLTQETRSENQVVNKLNNYKLTAAMLISCLALTPSYPCALTLHFM